MGHLLDSLSMLPCILWADMCQVLVVYLYANVLLGSVSLVSLF